jgi:hypothetical protein
LTRGSTDADRDAGVRRDVCEFFDNRLSPAHRAKFVHEVLSRDMAEVRLFLDRLEHYVASLDERTRQLPDVAPVLDEIAQDQTARSRYLEFARGDDRSAVRVRMIRLAEHLGWLSAEENRAELIRLIGDELARSRPTAADVDLVCKLNENREFDEGRRDLPSAAVEADDVGHAAMLACLGEVEGRARVLRALTSRQDADVRIAQVYLRRRPLSDIHELRRVTTEVAQMSDGIAQVHALDTLAYLRLSDPEALEELTRLFVVARSIAVQRAIAGILIRSDYPAMARPELLRTLRAHRLKSPDGRDLIDVLINRLQVAS